MRASDEKLYEAVAQSASVSTGRRRFMQAVLGGGLVASAVSFLYPVLRYLVPPASTDMGASFVAAAKVNELKVNSAKIFKFGSKPGLLIRTADGDYKAMAGTCTHLSCTVQYRDDLKQVWCACHNGFYDLNGRNLAGPPPRPLDSYEVHVQGEDVVVTRKQEA
ncbi:MAG: ubiquinol-cytochrome c reductase iron-sulfur subunit [Terriglobales bacterium]